MSPIKCTNCGKDMPDTYSYCASCGCSLSLNSSKSPWLSKGVFTIEIDPLPSYANMSKESIDMYSSYQDALKRIRKTKNMDTYFSSYDFIFYSLKKIAKIAELQKRKSEYDDYTVMFIIRSWNTTLKEANQLKTEKGRANRIQRYFDNLDNWSAYLKPIHLSLIEQIKTEYKAIPLPPVIIKLDHHRLSSIKDIENISPNDNVCYELQRCATAFKCYGYLDLAIACLRKSNEISDSNNGMGTLLLEEDYLRLPKYIRLSGNESLAAQEEAAINKRHPEFRDKRVTNLPRITAVIQQNDSDYVCVHTSSICEACSKYNHRIYSISGKSSKFPKIPSELVLDGGFCPNCITNISPYYDGISKPPTSDTYNTHLEKQSYSHTSQHRLPFNSSKRIFLFILCLFLGEFGLHRFFVGKTKSGFVYLFTFGGLCIGWLVDLYLIYTGKFTDKYGNYI